MFAPGHIRRRNRRRLAGGAGTYAADFDQASAADTDTWNQLTATIGASDITFSPAAAFPGGRIYSDTRNFPGKLAQVAAWNRVLTAAEIANLAAGYAPDLAAASGLQFYFKGNTSSLTAAPGGLGSADGTSSSTGVGNGPSIIYP